MTDGAKQYRDREAAERENAKVSTLSNVRDRSERSAEAWSKMADRAERSDNRRNVREPGERA